MGAMTTRELAVAGDASWQYWLFEDLVARSIQLGDVALLDEAEEWLRRSAAQQYDMAVQAVDGWPARRSVVSKGIQRRKSER
jgi:hypothetical protein